MDGKKGGNVEKSRVAGGGERDNIVGVKRS